jgi:hypothetical protein
VCQETPRQRRRQGNAICVCTRTQAIGSAVERGIRITKWTRHVWVSRELGSDNKFVTRCDACDKRPTPIRHTQRGPRQAVACENRVTPVVTKPTKGYLQSTITRGSIKQPGPSLLRKAAHHGVRLPLSRSINFDRSMTSLESTAKAQCSIWRTCLRLH